MASFKDAGERYKEAIQFDKAPPPPEANIEGVPDNQLPQPDDGEKALLVHMAGYFCYTKVKGFKDYFDVS